MNKKYMPRDVFEGGTALIAKLHLQANVPLEEIAAMVWSKYANGIIDDGVASDMVTAASDAIEWLRKIDAKTLPAFFHHFHWYCTCHDDEGKPKKKRVFNGLLFQKSVQDPNRVDNFSKKLKGYYIGLLSGQFPPAPDGWSL